MLEMMDSSDRDMPSQLAPIRPTYSHNSLKDDNSTEQNTSMLKAKEETERTAVIESGTDEDKVVKKAPERKEKPVSRAADSILKIEDEEDEDAVLPPKLRMKYQRRKCCVYPQAACAIRRV
jgi:hypothetical protein